MNRDTNFNKSLKGSQKAIAAQEKLLKLHFPKTFVKYENIEKKGKGEIDGYLTLNTNSIEKRNSVEIKIIGYWNYYWRNLKRDVFSLEIISKIESKNYNSSLINPKADLIIFFTWLDDEETLLKLVEVCYWKPLTDKLTDLVESNKDPKKFVQFWENYEQNITKTKNDDGSVWHTDNRYIPSFLVNVCKVGDY